jgi:hypothetical protein
MKKFVISLIVLVTLVTTPASPSAEALSFAPGAIFIDSLNQTGMSVTVNPSMSPYSDVIARRGQILLNYRTTMCGDDPVTAPIVNCPALYQMPTTVTFGYTPATTPTIAPIPLGGLRPGTQYTLWLSYDNGMRCFTTPCVSTTEDFQNRIIVTTLPEQSTTSSYLQISNITNTTASISAVIGNDQYQQFVQQALGLVVRYVKADLPFSSTETRLGYFIYSPDAQQLLPTDLRNLTPNTTYKISLGYQPRYSCTGYCLTVMPQPVFTDSYWTFTTNGTGSTPLLTQKLYKGIQSYEVTLLQNFLINRGYLSGAADGKFGSKTHKAVQLFQKANGLVPDGRVGPGTRAVINNLLQ